MLVLKLKDLIDPKIPTARMEIDLVPDFKRSRMSSNHASQPPLLWTASLGRQRLGSRGRPCDVEEASLRPDVSVVESGEVYIPPAGKVNIGYNIRLRIRMPL